MRLNNRMRKAGVMKLWGEGRVPNYLEPTTVDEHATKSFNYQLKEPTRLEGPWTDITHGMFIPAHVAAIQVLRPWQQQIFDTFGANAREVNYVWCTQGNIGKTCFTHLCVLKHNAYVIPPCNDQEKLVAATCNILEAKQERNPRCIFVDIPRAMDQRHLAGMMTAIEQIKSGLVYDMRYKYHQWWFNPPAVWVFANTKPRVESLSLDRWKIWHPQGENEELREIPLIDLQQHGEMITNPPETAGAEAGNRRGRRRATAGVDAGQTQVNLGAGDPEPQAARGTDQ